MEQFGEANHVAAAATVVAIEQILISVHQKAGFVIVVERAQPYPSAAAEPPGGSPIVRLTVVEQRNLLLQRVESLSIHGLLASTRRIRQSAIRSQATMVGLCRNRSLRPVTIQHQTTINRRRAHRQSVDESGKRDGSLQCGAACSTGSPPPIRSQACWRQCEVKCADGASQSGNTVNVLWQWRQMPTAPMGGRAARRVPAGVAIQKLPDQEREVAQVCSPEPATGVRDMKVQLMLPDAPPNRSRSDY